MKKIMIALVLCFSTISMVTIPSVEFVEAASVQLNTTNLTLMNVRSYTLKVKNTKKKVTWTSSNKKIATVNSKGLVKAVNNGTCYIYAKVDGKKLKCKVTVKTQSKPTSVKLNKTSLSLKVGSTSTLKATLNPTNVKDKTLKWSSSNTKIATVSSQGKVTAKKAGKVTISVTTSNKKKATCQVTVTKVSQKKIKDTDYVRIKDYIPSIYVDLKYSTTDNFTKQRIYNFKEAYLRYGTVKKLKKAQDELLKKGYSIKIWDAYRPYEAQKKLWKVCPNSKYVANPNKGPRNHNLGGTVDITLVTKSGKEIPMPTGFDNFTAKADRDYSDISNKTAVKNVKILENAMYKYGFKGYSKEWWHYNDTVTYKYVNYQPKK